MDILKQYEKENLEAVQQPAAEWRSQEFGDTGALTAYIMRFSGGKIKDVRQASYALSAVAVICIIASVLIIFFGSGNGLKQPSKDLINRPQP